jgi:hypothetical protein
MRIGAFVWNGDDDAEKVKCYEIDALVFDACVYVMGICCGDHHIRDVCCAFDQTRSPYGAVEIVEIYELHLKLLAGHVIDLFSIESGRNGHDLCYRPLSLAADA